MRLIEVCHLYLDHIHVLVYGGVCHLYLDHTHDLVSDRDPGGGGGRGKEERGCLSPVSGSQTCPGF